MIIVTRIMLYKNVVKVYVDVNFYSGNEAFE